MSTSLLCEKAYQITNAKAYVFPDSVLCVGKMGDDPIATWKNKIKWYSENNHFKYMNRIDGEPTEFERKIFQGITTLGLLEKIQSLMRDLQCEPEHFTERILFMSMYNDIAWEKGNTERCDYNSKTIAEYARRFRAVVCLSWGLEQKRNGTDRQTWRILGPNGRGYHTELLRSRSSNNSCLQCIWERRIAKQWRRQEVHTLQR